MARLRTIGCEIAAPTTVTGNVFEGYSVGTIARDTTIKRSGASSFKCGSATSQQNSFEVANITATVNQCFARCWFYIATADGLPTADAKIMRFADSAALILCSVRLTTAGALQLWNDVGAVQIGSNSTAVPLDRWFCVEMAFTPGAGATCALSARFNFDQFATGASLTISNTALWRVGCGYTVAPGANKFIYVDDFAVNDVSGAAQNTWPGDGKIVYLFPVSDNARVGWVAGAAGTTNLFAAVDNIPPGGVALASATNTSQIKDLANNTTDAYTANMTDYLTAGVPSDATVTLVQPCIDCGQDSATATSFTFLIVTNPAGGNNTGIGVTTIAGTWPTGWHGSTTATGASRWGTALTTPTVTLSTQPTMRVVKGTASATITQMVDGMFIAVEYVERRRPMMARTSVVCAAAQRAATR